MDQELMNAALASVLGEGYQAKSRTSGVGSETGPSPRDFLQQHLQKDASGADMHVMTTPSPRSKTKLRGKFKPAITTVDKSFLHPQPETQAKVGAGLTAAGAAGGALSLPSLAGHTTDKLRQGGILKPKGLTLPSQYTRPAAMQDTNAAVKGLKGAMKPIKSAVKYVGDRPKLAAGMAAGAAGLEVAGLAGDVVAHHSFKQQAKAGAPIAKSDEITFSKVDDDLHQVFGWVSLSKKDGEEVVDLQGDHVPIEEIEKSAYDYMLRSRKAGNQHARVMSHLGDEPKHVGDVIESVVYTPEKIEKMGLPDDFPQGWWMGMQIHDEETWQQIKNGERAGFSIHGKGKREEIVAKRSQAYDGKERAKDIALGAAGTTAAGSGATAALLPKLAEKGVLRNTERAVKASDRLRVVGATVGGAAGVYGGLHAVRTAIAADQNGHRFGVRKDWSEYDAERKTHSQANSDAKRFLSERGSSDYNNRAPARVANTWSPVVQGPSLEERRGKRAKVYEGAAVGGAATAGALSGAYGVRAVRANRQSKMDTAAAKGAERQRLVREYRGREEAANREHAENPKRGLKQVAHAHQVNVAGIRLEAKGAHSEAMKAIDAKPNAAKLVARAAMKRGGVTGAAALGLGAVAEGIHRKRSGSWRPYPGIR